MTADFFSFFYALNRHLEAHPDHLLALHFKEVDDFACSRCAQCCSLPWSVGASEAYIQRWKPVFEAHEDPRFHDIFEAQAPDSPSGHMAHLRKQAGSTRCVLLDQDNLCLAQKHFGKEAKPQACQLYPYLWQRVGGPLQISHLMQSCYLAPSYLLSAGELSYRLIPAEEAQSAGGPLFPLLVTSGLAFSRESLYLWLGFLLDHLLFESEKRSPLQNLRGFTPVLRRLLSLASPETTSYVVSPAEIENLYQQDLTWLGQSSSALPLRQAYALEWFLVHMPRTVMGESIHAFYTEVLQGKRQLPMLAEQEYALIKTFLHNYLARKLLSCHQWFTQRVNFFQQYLLFAAFPTLIQAQLLAYRELRAVPIDARLLGQAVNLIEGQLLQSYLWLETHGFPQKSAEACLEEAEKLLSFDLTRAPVPFKSRESRFKSGF
ncbi:hypothetical protein COW36_21915 [bacterium (Candidatus Blackallbacteria) CG17_big_fil_post_rev_8_21_14_2_50_48_46]|uniref:YkgJ family cysteine cluster protein n=1 Tax=bacterium (Candidatus Blackallbacteria) CG17_big_fil_post_rev_8_21_14_2_50_48_46 TaxID=2014261 RepID=A0A2M7FY68_9BACT|nr:MAG: hypothetical protein COW64_13345 [bacterium (Candidatus Blackallbacteria) CG18_big_fil_WC_8_21_14_2_50_49_26]PIW14275.1 MAG: hypothetical protein COW36_21915 [bacterium (Candidatus Blackallbacteria) CG17_big_fil_post_rev_8_21_14_2_50_48_46]PIW45544.1 MAG: hypothetical protein COW20_19520 [bacterium (Candidatus Blackallbacteria) CG13_big_fil_rev_8_21_14_2_50_49_14]